MPQLLKIKSRIKSVESTLKITKAMKITAAARLIKAKERVFKLIPMINKVDEIIEKINIKNLLEINTNVKKIKKILYVVLTTNRGFCGGFNLKLLHYAMMKAEKELKNIYFMPIGEKGIDFFEKFKNIEILPSNLNYIWDENLFNQGSLLYNKLKIFFSKGIYDEIYLVYNEFSSILLQNPIKKQLFPLIIEKKYEKNNEIDYLFEPNKKNVIKNIIYSYCKLKILRSIIETKAGEYSARMTSMEGANINGEKLIKKLKIQYQRARQEMITKELSELIGGVECLKNN